MSIRRGTIPIYCAIGLSAAASLFVASAIQPVPTLIFPVLVSAMPLAARTQRAVVTLRWTATGLLLAFVLLGLMTVGVFFLPALLAMVLAAERVEARAG